jgi:addiction module RelB/DinJ family antitoxin
MVKITRKTKNSVKTENVHVRMNAALKRDVTKIFDRMGLSVSQAITLFYCEVSARDAFPFTIRRKIRK